MALPATPTVTYGAPGSALASQALAASGSVSFNVDFSTSLGGWISPVNTGGATVGATNGCQVAVFAARDNVPAYDTIATTMYTIPTVASSTAAMTTGLLPPAKYRVTLTNLDTANGITVAAAAHPVA